MISVLSLPWLTAITFRLLRISLVLLLIERMSQPIKRGACIKLSPQHGLINEQKYVQFVLLYFSDIFSSLLLRPKLSILLPSLRPIGWNGSGTLLLSSPHFQLPACLGLKAETAVHSRLKRKCWKCLETCRTNHSIHQALHMMPTCRSYRRWLSCWNITFTGQQVVSGIFCQDNWILSGCDLWLNFTLPKCPWCHQLFSNCFLHHLPMLLDHPHP